MPPLYSKTCLKEPNVTHTVCVVQSPRLFGSRYWSAQTCYYFENKGIKHFWGHSLWNYWKWKGNRILQEWIIEPRHNKTNKIALRPAKTQISRIRVFAVRMKKAWILSYPLSTQRRLWSNWADAQADLSLRWAHTHFVCWFCHVEAQMSCQ